MLRSSVHHFTISHAVAALSVAKGIPGHVTAAFHLAQRWKIISNEKAQSGLKYPLSIPDSVEGQASTRPRLGYKRIQPRSHATPEWYSSQTSWITNSTKLSGIH
jgi:hypothetical protein